VAVWSNSLVKSFRDALDREMVMGSTGAATSDSVYARVLNEIVGTRFKLIAGYKGNPDIIMAAERGEIMGRAGWFVSGMLATQGQQIAEGKILVLVQLAWQKHPALPNVPLITEFVSDPDKRDQLAFSLSWHPMGRPYVAPPGVPPDRVKLLRDSFIKTLASPEFLAEARGMSLDINPLSGEDVQALVQKLYATPKPLVDRLRAILIAK
jgi:tripartite-type tricarboxylate transporter receptor subunit TctC